MKRKELFYLIAFAAGIALLNSCGSSDKIKESDNQVNINTIVQQPDGTISLKLEKAERYSDIINPSENTAEWNVVVSKSGRYNIWLSTATRDTTDLNYKNKVLVSVQDKRIEARPECDKIVRNSSEVSFPYFRADSYVGSMYIKDTGEFHIQVISEQIMPDDYNKGDVSGKDLAKLLSVSFTPVKR